MDEELISHLAIDETDPYGLELDPQDLLLFYELREAYRRYGAGYTPKEGCVALKRIAVRRRDALAQKLADAEKVQRDWASFWQRVEYAATVYAKSEGRTEEADAFYEAVYRLRPSRKHDNDLPIEKGKQNERKRNDYAASRDCIAKQSEKSPG